MGVEEPSFMFMGKYHICNHLESSILNFRDFRCKVRNFFDFTQVISDHHS